MIVFEILLYILLSLLFILFLILVLPIYYAAAGQKQDTVFLEAMVFGLLKWFNFTYELQGMAKHEMHLSLFGINVNIQNKKKQGKVEKEEKDKRDKKKMKEKGKEHGKGFLKKMLSMAKDLWKHIKPRHLQVKGRYGFEDPYHTGLACAIINCTAPYGDRCNVNLTPVFDDQVIEGRFETEGRIIPIVILWILAKVFVIPRLKIDKPFARKARGL